MLENIQVITTASFPNLPPGQVCDCCGESSHLSMQLRCDRCGHKNVYLNYFPALRVVLLTCSRCAVDLGQMRVAETLQGRF